MTTPITYVNDLPKIPTHLGTDAPHVHHLGSDRCLRVPDGEHCPTPAELRAEVERLTGVIADRLGEYALFGRSKDGDSTLTGDLAADMGAYAQRLKAQRDDAIARALAFAAERDALQQQVANVQALADDLEAGQGPMLEWNVPVATTYAGLIRAALGGPAAPTPEPTITGYDGFEAGVWTPRYQHAPLHVRQQEPVERITDDRGDELEHGEHKPGECSICDAARRQPTSGMPAPCATDGSCSWPSCICGADTDAEAANQPQDGGA